MEVIRKVVRNECDGVEYVGDVLMYSCESGKKVFRSARDKNDMPCVCSVGKNVIVSDSLTIIDDLFICFMGGKKHLVRTEVSEKGVFVYGEVNKYLEVGESFELEELDVFRCEDINEGIKWFALKKKGDLIVRNTYVPKVYCTWYYYGKYVNYQDCLVNLEKIPALLFVNTFQIDDGWQKMMGEWVANRKFGKLEDVGSLINRYGLKAGIWTAPFVADKRASVWKKHPEWRLKSKNGGYVKFNGYYVIDITIKETWDYFRELYKGLSHSFCYHKVDFTRCVLSKDADYYDKHETIISCYRKAFEAIKEGIGEGFLLVCGGLYDPLIGIADGQRSSSDVRSVWKRVIKIGGQSLPYVIKQNLLRYYMNYWWFNDPDALMIRKNFIIRKGGLKSLGLLNEQEARLACLNQILGKGIKSICEPLDRISDDRKEMIEKALAGMLEKEDGAILGIENEDTIIGIDNLMAMDESFWKVIISENKYAIINFKDEEKDGLKPHSGVIVNVRSRNDE